MKELTKEIMKFLLKVDNTVETIESAQKTKDSAITIKYTLKDGVLSKDN